MKQFTKMYDFLTIQPGALTMVLITILVALAIVVSQSPFPLFAVLLYTLVQGQQISPAEEEEPEDYSGNGMGFSANV